MARYSEAYGLARLPEQAPSAELKAARYERLNRRRAANSTSKFCHGCGKSGTYRSFRPADDVCDDCLMLFWRGEDADFAREKSKQERELEIILVPVRRWSSGHPAFPSWSNPAYAHSREAHDALEEFQCAAADLLAIFLEPFIVEKNTRSYNSEGKAHPKGHYYTDCPRNLIYAPPGTGDAIDLFDAAGQRVLTAMHAAGVDRGKSILAQLADGDITVDQFQGIKRQ